MGLLLDEAWLRARRNLVIALENASLWPGAAEHAGFISKQRANGEALRDSVLLRDLAEEDRRWLPSPALFAAANRRFRSRVPMALSFGYELSAGLQSLDANETDVAVAETCGLFNFGISVFDLLHDAQPQLVSRFTSYFDRDVLLRLNAEAVAPSELQRTARTAEEPEIRLLLQVIAGVYERLHRLGAGSRGAYEKVTSLLALAYAAEIRSAACDAAPTSERLEIARAKSTLPFVIIDAIGELRHERNGSGALHDAVISEIGTIFWLTDDLVDLVGDSRSGALNAILIGATGGEGLDIGASLRRLLEGRAIEETTATIRDAIVRLHDRLSDRGAAGAAFARVVTSYVRMWLE